MTDGIRLERRGSVATIVIDTPERRNAISYDGWLRLGSIARSLAEDEETRVVVLTGSGDQAFSAGADIKDFDTYRTDSGQARVYQAAFDAAVEAIESLPVPTVCKIKGYCVGGGCELTLAADIRIAADNAKFGVPAARLGIVIGYEEMRRLVALVGPGHASYLLMSGRIVGVEEASRFGLVDQVLPLAEVDEYVSELADEMSRLAPLSHRQHKQIMRRVTEDPLLSGLTSEERNLPFVNFDSADFDEGRRAFLERRKPVFQGR
jgi:enoyl-CoA hydratase/carnithine racemase